MKEAAALEEVKSNLPHEGEIKKKGWSTEGGVGSRGSWP